MLQAPIISEIAKLEIQEFGIQPGELEGEPDLSFLRLADGTTLYGNFSGEPFARLHREVQPNLDPPLTLEALTHAIQAARHYIYPVSLPAWTPPYSMKARRHAFGRFGSDTIDDLPRLTTDEKRDLKKVFTPREGTLFVDCGTWLGYGSLRVRRSMPGVKVVAFEADKENYKIAKYNFDANECSDITLINKAVWSSRGEMEYLERGGVGRGSASMLALVEKETEDWQPLLPLDTNKVVIETESVDLAVGEMAKDHDHIHISITINGAEIEAIRGMENLLASAKSISIATFSYAPRVYDSMKPLLESFGFRVVKGRGIRVLAWK